MFNNKVSRKELFTSNPGQILQQQIYRRDLNDSAFQSSENPSDLSSQMENSQGSCEVYSQRFSQSCSQPSESSSSQKFYRKYMSKAPLFQRDTSYNTERPSSKRASSDYHDHLEVNKQKAKEKDNRDLLNTFVSLVKDCSDEVKTAVEIIKDSVNKNLSDSADQSAVLIDKINEGLSVHYQRLLEAIQTDHKQRLTTSELREIVATRDAKIELLEFQLETAQKAKDQKVMAFLKEAYDEQKQVTKNQLELLQKNQQIINEEHIKTLQEQQEMFNKEKIESNTECKHCDGQGVTNDSDPVQKAPPTVLPNEFDVRDTNQQRGAYPPNQNMYSTQHNLQPQAICTSLPTAAMYHTNQVSHACWSQHMNPSNHIMPNRINHFHGLTSHQPSSGLYHPQAHSIGAVFPQPLSSSTPSISPIVSASFARWSKESFIKKPSPVATVVPLVKAGVDNTTGRHDTREMTLVKASVDNTTGRHDENDSIEFNTDQASKYPASLNIAPTRQSERLRANVENSFPRSSNHNEMGQKIQIRRNKRTFNNTIEDDQLISNRKPSPQAEHLHSNGFKMAAARPKSGKIIHQEINYVPIQDQPVTSEVKKHLHDRKNFKKHKAKPKRKFLKSKGLPKSSSYSNLNAASRSSSDNWKRHSSLTVAVDSSSDDNDDIFLSFLDQNSPPTKLCKLTQGEKLISSHIIGKYPDTDDTQQESSQESNGGDDPPQTTLQRESCNNNQMTCNAKSNRKKKTFERTEQDDSEEDEHDHIFSGGAKNTQRKYIARRDKNNKASYYNQDPASSRRQLLNISDTNILEISKYIRQQQSRRQDR